MRAMCQLHLARVSASAQTGRSAVDLDRGRFMCMLPGLTNFAFNVA